MLEAHLCSLSFTFDFGIPIGFCLLFNCVHSAQVGALCRLTATKGRDPRKMTVNVEYNQLEGLFKCLFLVILPSLFQSALG